MGSLADLIVAPSEDAPAILASDYPLESFNGVNVDGLDPLMLAALHSLLTQREFKDVLPDYHPVAEASANGPWLVSLPAELREALVNLHPEDHASTAAKWASAHQLREEGRSEHDAVTFLGRAVHFARTAAFEEKNLFLCLYG